MYVLANWWENSIKSNIFQIALHTCTNDQLKETYTRIKDLKLK